MKKYPYQVIIAIRISIFVQYEDQYTTETNVYLTNKIPFGTGSNLHQALGSFRQPDDIKNGIIFVLFLFETN